MIIYSIYFAPLLLKHTKYHPFVLFLQYFSSCAVSIPTGGSILPSVYFPIHCVNLLLCNMYSVEMQRTNVVYGNPLKITMNLIKLHI